jgi:hypothetical protein
MPPYSWAYQGNAGPDPTWLQLDVGSIQDVAGIVIQGYAGYNWFARTVSVSVSIDNKAWGAVACGLNFKANVDGGSKVNIIFPAVVSARYVRILPQT